MASVYGLPTCDCVAAWLPRFLLLIARRGISVRVTQLTGNYGASGGTHAGGGAIDVIVVKRGWRTRSAAYRLLIKLARLSGAEGSWWRRKNWDGKGGIEHGHLTLSGCPHRSPQAKAQETAVERDQNGLANKGKDDGYRPLPGRSWSQGLAWMNARITTRARVGTWNVALKYSRPGLGDRVSRIRRRVKQARLTVLMVQEAPVSGDGRYLPGTLVDDRGQKMRRVGSHGRHIYYARRGVLIDWASWVIEGKRVTLAAIEIDGLPRVWVNCHPISGAEKARQRARYAREVLARAPKWAAQHDIPVTRVIYAGDFNGGEFTTAAAPRGVVRARGRAKWKNPLTRTYNAWGKRKPTEAGGAFDRIHINADSKAVVERYQVVSTPQASDHNLVHAQLKE